MSNLLSELKAAPVRFDPYDPEPDSCSCSDCGWSGKVSDCESETEQECWEMPSYTVHLCPNCAKTRGEVGCVDDYFYDWTLWRRAKFMLRIAWDKLLGRRRYDKVWPGEEKVEQRWKDTKGVSFITGEAWLTPRMERNAARTQRAWGKQDTTQDET